MSLVDGRIVNQLTNKCHTETQEVASIHGYLEECDQTHYEG